MATVAIKCGLVFLTNVNNNIFDKNVTRAHCTGSIILNKARNFRTGIMGISVGES